MWRRTKRYVILPSNYLDAEYDGIPHGTERGYKIERKRGLVTCAECRAESNRARNARKRTNVKEAS